MLEIVKKKSGFSSSKLFESFLAVKQNGFFLLFPAADIYSLESTLDVQPKGKQDTWTIGRVDVRGYCAPIFAMDDKAHLTNRRDSENSALVVFSIDEHYFALASRAVKLVNRTDLKFQLLPRCMQMENSFSEEVAVLNNGVAFVLTGEKLWRYMESFGAAKEIIAQGHKQSHQQQRR